MNWRDIFNKNREVGNQLLDEKALLSQRLREINKQLKKIEIYEPYKIMSDIMCQAYNLTCAFRKNWAGFHIDFYKKRSPRVRYGVPLPPIGSIYVECKDGELLYFKPKSEHLAFYDVADPFPLPGDCEEVYKILTTRAWSFHPKGDWSI
jgi:hypothetical protein